MRHGFQLKFQLSEDEESSEFEGSFDDSVSLSLPSEMVSRYSPDSDSLSELIASFAICIWILDPPMIILNFMHPLKKTGKS